MAPGRGFRDPVSAGYARAGIDRIVTTTVPAFAAAAAVAAATNLVATLPHTFFAAQSARLGLVEVAGPVPDHSVSIALCWHERTHTDRALSAFRELVRAALHGSARVTS